jgi:hypothetical protein
MPNRCVLYGCCNEPNLEKVIVLHCIPFADDERQEARKRRKKWIDFVQRKRLKWTPGTTSSMFSQHFKDDFQRKFFVLASEEQNMKYMPRLKRDEIGVSVCPSFYLSSSSKPEETERDISRKVSYSTVFRPKFLSAFNKRFFRCIYLLLICIDFSCEVW